jgi:arylsulfatase
MKPFTYAVLLCAPWAAAWAQDSALPRPDPQFRGKLAPKREDSVASWPDAAKPPSGAPNVVLILLDDVGFGATSAMGGPAHTPVLERLAASGLRYNRFHVNALCSPTRASLLTGRNNHQVGFGSTTELAAGYPGYNSMLPKSAATIAEVLRQNGYSTAAFGKWHNTPVWEVSPVGPFDRWPTGLGFEYFYGFMAAMTSQWEPKLYRNTIPVDPPGKPSENYHLTTDLVNDAIRWLHQHDSVAPEKPFFIYFATGATHDPHHVAKEWIAKYKGRFDEGWDTLRERTFGREKSLGVIPADAELTPRPPELPAWNSLTADEKKLLARQMEVYAGFLEQTDYEVGRLLDAVKARSQADNTLVLYIVGDNGASGEGGLEGQESGGPYDANAAIPVRLQYIDSLGSETFANHYAAAWAWGADSPFQWMKQVASHLGGIRDPLIVSWPARIKGAGLRTQFTHITDIAPTIYEATGIRFPDAVNGVPQIPLEGQSLLYTFDHPEAPSRHTLQYFEMLGSRGIYKDGWFAGARNMLPWEIFVKGFLQASGNQWELYDLAHDYSQAHDLASRYPEKLKELQEAFDSEAWRNHVYPLMPVPGTFPNPSRGKTSFTYAAGVARLPFGVTPNLAGRSQRIAADIEITSQGAQGVIISQGSRYGGFTFYVKDGRLVYETDGFGPDHQKMVSSEPLPPGKVQVAFEFKADEASGKESPMAALIGSPRGGVGRISINGKTVGEARFTRFGPFSGVWDTLDVGANPGSPVSRDYSVPFAFTGKIDKVTVDLL